MHTLKDEWITASDGARICVDVHLPDGDGPFPSLYAVAPYQKDLLHLPPVSAFRFIETGPIDYWTGHGYAVVVGDQRGTGKSEGSSSCSDRPSSATSTTPSNGSPPAPGRPARCRCSARARTA
ncbi:hypothetical protein GCM10025734_82530 [Kitasatospora paranensis]